MSRPGKAKREARRQKRIAEGKTEEALVPLGIMHGDPRGHTAAMRKLAANVCARGRAYDRGDVSNTSTGMLFKVGAALAYAADRLDAEAKTPRVGKRIRLKLTCRTTGIDAVYVPGNTEGHIREEWRTDNGLHVFLLRFDDPQRDVRAFAEHFEVIE